MATIFFAVLFLLTLAVHAEDAVIGGRDKPVAEAKADTAKADVGGNQIDLVFVLDSTGSMSNLIEGAKDKIWSIANSMITLPSKPTIRIGLLTYRDRGDDYVTKLFDLTDDIDKVFANLKLVTATGGGDLPESVNQALDEAVNKMSWDKTNANTYRVIFLVGDAPPHMDYVDDVKYHVTCDKAAETGIVINTIQCGNIAECTTFWQEIAKKSEGEFVKIAQSGDVKVVATPFDAEIKKLTGELNKTVVTYGKESVRQSVLEKLNYASNSKAEVQADRAEFNLMTKGKAIQGEGDLVADIESGKTKLGTLKDSELPPTLRDKNSEEKENYIKNMTEKRNEINKKIAEQVKLRNEWLENEKKKDKKNNTKNSFDSRVQTVIENQSKKIFNKND
ncbi:MAG: VWA domain-containing protein [Planctomycetaceae bacterium]|nr:VWA domain-containing protein [Planctomycetaceae bacterium]